MDMRALGGSGLETPRLVLGGNVFGWTANGEEAFAILDRFAEAGGTMIDTADVYSAWVPGHKGGESETLLGEWIRRRGGSKGVMIATKVGMLPMGEPVRLEAARIVEAADASLGRLGVEAIDLFSAHQVDEATPLAVTLAGFDRLVRDGKVRALGASNYSAARLAEALDISEREGLARYEVLQPEYNLMSRDKYEGALQSLCVERNVGVLPYFGLASGFLTGKYRSTDDFAKSARGGGMDRFFESGQPVIAAMDQVAAETGASHAAIALAWLNAQPGIAAPIASARTVEQLPALLEGAALKLSQEQLAKLTAAGA
jgi:aryl-alcohol dehydrogenase-like predicted oxidoreductase